MPTKIQFSKFKYRLVKCLILATITTILSDGLMTIGWHLFAQKETIENYTLLLPSYLQVKSWFLNKEQFIVLGLAWVAFFSLFTYFSALEVERLTIRVSDYSKNRLLSHFRRLSLTEKLKRKEEINSLVEIESNLVGEYWVKLVCETYKGTFNLGLLFWSAWYSEWKVGPGMIIFTIFWLIFINIIIYLFNRANFRLGKLSKQITTREYGLINKEINNAFLVESMGLNLQLEQEQQILTRQSRQKKTKFKSRMIAGKIIPWTLLVNLFPFGLLILNKNFIGEKFSTLWRILNNCVWQFGYLWNYSDYSSSLTRINTFLSLPQKNDNLEQLKFPTNLKIITIDYQNISFRYPGQKEWLLKNYSRTFTPGTLNHLTGKNGSGKSTLLYLLLGLLTPNKGKIIITDNQGNNYNLHQDLNLQSWRENNIAYCSHETLIEEGSTGQKQWANIQDTLQRKSHSQIFLFDEADNGLDKENQARFKEVIEGLGKERVVIRAE
ncbi:MAG: ABC transporter family protein [Mycoplasmataceae bacterium RV_VA103A]|nr:MAG: ABC transporter family protein [Mycoplasmataceae bacterium RV_VA103A]